jgi:pectate lyase
MHALVDARVVQAARAGDQQALTDLISAHLPLVYNVVGRALRGHPDVDDVVQEVMVRVVQSLPSLREPEHFRSWLMAIALRQVQERERRGTPSWQQPLDDALDVADPESEFVDETINRIELSGERSAFVEASRWLSPTDRRILLLWWQETVGDLTRAEVATALSMSGPHTAVRVQRMKERLRRARCVVAAWRAMPRCPQLTELAHGWDRRPDPTWLKRLNRHVQGCETCAATGRLLAPVERLVGAIAPLALGSVLAEGQRSVAATSALGIHAPARLLHRAGHYLSLKPALVAGTAVAGAAVVALTLLPWVQPSGPAALPPSSAPTVVVPTAAAGTAAPSTAISPTQPPSTTTGPSAATDLGVVGWGAGTTGGAGGTTVTVTSFADLLTEAKTAGSRIIRVNGTFTCAEDVVVTSDKSILGVGSDSGLTGCGLSITDASNVVVRNMNISKVLATTGSGDAIHVEHATRVWLDHNDLSSDTTHASDYYDGLIDLTHAADYVTVSWNVLHDHIKCSLVGHSDTNGAEDIGHLRITYHHNLFRNCGQRSPRVRFGNPIHVYNNYFVQTTTAGYSYSIATTDGAGILLEGNYFENVPTPVHLGEASSAAGSLVARDNYSVGSGPIVTSGSVAAIPYTYQLDPAADVKSIVTEGAGTGKIKT